MPPDRIFKYQPVADHAVENIRARRVWLSTPDQFNDPLDCALQVIRPRFTDADVQAVLTALRAREILTPDDAALMFDDHDVITPKGRQMLEVAARDAFEEHRNSALRSIGVSCFAGCLDDVLMWSHYAAGHRGICLEFSTDGPPFSDAREVNYASQVPSIAPDAVFDPVRRASVAEAMLLTKHRSWSYEQEWRVIQREGNVAVEFARHLLKAVYLGVAITESDRRRCREAAGSTPVIQMSIAPASFRVGPAEG